MRSKLLKTLFFAICAVFISTGVIGLSATVLHAQNVSVNPGTSGLGSASDDWREIKEGTLGKTSLPDKSTGFLIRIQGEDWRNIRNNMVFTYGAMGLGVMVVALLLFYLIRGRINLDGELTGRKVQRFKAIERYNHWTMATTFILLGLTGLNMLYGRAVFIPLMGAETFSDIAAAGKFIHNNIAWVFILSLLMTIIFWTKDNLWDRYDLNWILKGGGLFTKGVHPPSAKFNFGEKTMFWLIALGGIAISATGLALLFPNILDILPALQLMQIIHSVMGLVMVIAILGHIYIGTIGMEGALESMTTGYVDETWAKEHHAAWAEDHGIKVEHRKQDEEHITQGGVAQ